MFYQKFPGGGGKPSCRLDGEEGHFRSRTNERVRRLKRHSAAKGTITFDIIEESYYNNAGSKRRIFIKTH
jgi:hypothetical protein